MRNIFFIIVIAFFLGCEPKSSKSNQVVKSKIIPDSETVVVYKPDSSILPYLNKIIDKEKTCDFYNKNNSCFLVYQRPYSVYNNDTVIDIVSGFLNSFNWKNVVGVSYFKDHIFIILNNLSMNCVFTKTKKSFTIHFNHKDDEFEQEPMTNDLGSDWVFSCRNDSAYLLFKSVCHR
ncbi:MAG: hypothetical protein GX259_04790 [Bacteroidales bacterium]|nr:hypothetical protein [Bacteroidales bacterium]